MRNTINGEIVVTDGRQESQAGKGDIRNGMGNMPQDAQSPTSTATPQVEGVFN